eukprot:2353817-Amphidinium_carterae.1
MATTTLHNAVLNYCSHFGSSLEIGSRLEVRGTPCVHVEVGGTFRLHLIKPEWTLVSEDLFKALASLRGTWRGTFGTTSGLLWSKIDDEEWKKVHSLCGSHPKPLKWGHLPLNWPTEKGPLKLGFRKYPNPLGMMWIGLGDGSSSL